MKVFFYCLLWGEVDFVEQQMDARKQVIGYPLYSSIHVK